MLRRIGYSVISFAPEAEGGAGGANGGASSSPSTATPSSSSDSSAGASGSPSGASTSGKGNVTPSAGAQAGLEEGDTSQTSGLDLWSGLGEADLDQVEIPAEAGEKKDDGKPAPKEEAKPAAAEAAKVEPKPEAPAAVAPSQGDAGKSPLPDPSRPGELAKAMETNFEPLVEQIVASGLFNLSDKEKEALETDFVGSLPSLGAKVYARAVIQTMRQLQNVIPHMIEAHMKVKTANTSNEAKFYARWPDIDPTQHGDLVKRLGFAYRQANPNSTFEQMLEELGPMVMGAGKIQPKAPGGVTPPAKPQKQQPFVPAGGGPAAAPRMVSQGEWDGLGGTDSED